MINYLTGMKKFLFLFITVACVTAVSAQDSTVTTTTKTKKDWSKVKLGNRANDHFMIQIGHNGWSQKPDSLNTRGLSRSFNMYFMFDFPFKSDPRFSIGIGAGFGTDNVYFKNTDIDITGRNSNKLTFKNVADTNHFKKYKLMTTYLEAPVELRFAVNPENTNRSWKFAIGGKIGTLMSASTKGKTLQNKNGNTINAFTQKEKAKRFFDGTRLSATGRISYGVFGIYGAYQINSFIKDGMGPDVRPFQIGLVISGL